MALVIVTWLWGDKYGKEYAERLVAGVKRNMRQPIRMAVISDDARIRVKGAEAWPIFDEGLTNRPGCFARLRMFDPSWQAMNGVGRNDRLACIDLDAIVTGELDPLFDRPEPFLILQGANASNPCPYNGSLWMLRGGYRPDVWGDFSLEVAAKVPHHSFPDDQAWMAHKLPDAAGWKAGPESGVYAFQKPGWPQCDALPKGARLVAFPGWRDPSKFTGLKWVRENWR